MRKGSDLAGIFYTGGTTGRSKGVMLSHQNLMANALNALGEGMFPASSIYLHAAPMFHLANGAAMYSLQALWTMARERLDVVTVICANRSYNILNIELGRVGALNPGPKTLAMLDLHDPELDFVKMAQGMGVEASRAATTREFASQFADAMERRGPRLIEAVLNA